MIYDAHVHVFRELHGRVAGGSVTGLGYGRARIGDEAFQMLPPIAETTTFTIGTLLASMDWAGVDRAMLLQGPFYGNQDVLVCEAVQTCPKRLHGAFMLDPWSDDAREAFRFAAASGAFRALKLELSVTTGLCGIHPEAHLDSAEIAWLWRELEQRQLVLVLDLGAVGSRSYQTDAVHGIAESFPQLKIVIAHLGQIGPAIVNNADSVREWRRQIALGQLPNVWFDCSSLPAYWQTESYPYPSVANCLRRAIDQIGPEKVLWASDIPGTLGQLNYRQLVELGHVHSSFLTSRDQSLFLGENALHVFGA